MKYITITGHKHYFGLIPFSVGTELSLRHEPENMYDAKAMAVFSPVYGKVGYVANQKETMAEGTVSASACKGENKAVIRFIAGDYIIAEILS